MKTVLLVDDEPALTEYLSMLFRAQGFHTIEASNGVLALASMFRNPKIDLVVSDVDMPDGDGRWLLAQLQRMYPEIPVVIVTGDLRLGHELLSEGARRVYHKPLTEEVVMEITAWFETNPA